MPELLSIGRDAGLTDVLTVSNLDVLVEAGLVERTGSNYSIANDFLAARLAREISPSAPKE
jgi:hypothetical protein